MSAFTPAALEYLADHAIDPAVAEALGVATDGLNLLYPYRTADGEPFIRTRELAGDRRTKNPLGVNAEPWIPTRQDGVLFVCEGESDLLAVASVIFRVEDLAEPGEDPDLILCRRDDLPPPIAELTPVALPGAAVCHRKIAQLAADKSADAWIALDGDKAGRTNAAKLQTKIEAVGQSAGILSLPDGMDISDLLVAADDPVEALANLVAEAEASAVEDAHGDADLLDIDDIEEVKPLPADIIGGVLEEVAGFIERYVVLPSEEARTAIALFVAHSHAIGAAHATAYLLVTSPEKGSGKTRLEEAIGLLVKTPWHITSASEAAMFRKIARDKPTLLLDEIDAIFGSGSERTEPIRAIINAGNRPGASVARCVGEKSEVEDFPVFCAKVLAGIDTGGRIPDTIRDRSIPIAMQRKTPDEPVAKFRHRFADVEAAPIRSALAGWAAGAGDLLLEAEPDLPDELGDRAAEAWEPLLAIADLAGGQWPAQGRSAALALSAKGANDESTIGTILLEAIRAHVGDRDRIASSELIESINGDDELPFGGWRDGKGIDSRRLARMLKAYAIRPRTIRLDDGSTPKGYLTEQFVDAWERWLPPGERRNKRHSRHTPQKAQRRFRLLMRLWRMLRMLRLPPTEGEAPPQEPPRSRRRPITEPPLRPRKPKPNAWRRSSEPQRDHAESHALEVGD